MHAFFELPTGTDQMKIGDLVRTKRKTGVWLYKSIDTPKRISVGHIGPQEVGLLLGFEDSHTGYPYMKVFFGRFTGYVRSEHMEVLR